MSRHMLRTAGIVAAAMAILSCSSPTEPRITDVDLARSAWLANRPPSYSFELAWHSSWFGSTGFLRVQVVNGQVVAASDATGKPVANYSITVDSIWDDILAARARGDLNSVEFDQRGVPVESDMGPWAVDGGVHYSVRNFVESR
jgi:hypothetical protein